MSGEEEVKLDLLHTRLTTGGKYTDGYRDYVFYTWYSHNRCAGNTLRGYLEPDIDGNTPHPNVLMTWIREDFQSRADKLDEIVKSEMESKAVTEKIEMLSRHADIGKEMQAIAIDYLREHKDELKPNTAARLLVDGVRIERESRGLPSLVAETLKTSDEEMMEAIAELLNKTEPKENDTE